MCGHGQEWVSLLLCMESWSYCHYKLACISFWACRIPGWPLCGQPVNSHGITFSYGFGLVLSGPFEGFFFYLFCFVFCFFVFGYCPWPPSWLGWLNRTKSTYLGSFTNILCPLSWLCCNRSQTRLSIGTFPHLVRMLQPESTASSGLHHLPVLMAAPAGFEWVSHFVWVSIVLLRLLGGPSHLL